jgi:hypothetical protein
MSRLVHFAGGIPGADFSKELIYEYNTRGQAPSPTRYSLPLHEATIAFKALLANFQNPQCMARLI